MSNKLRKIFQLRNILTAISVIAVLALALSYLSVFVHPKTIGFLPLFGLAYQLIFFGNILLLVVCFFMKSRMKWIVLATILLGGTLPFRTFCIGWDDTNVNNSTELKVLSYNVRLFDVYNPDPKTGVETRSKIVDFLQKEKADIYCLQEFYYKNKKDVFNTKDSLQKFLSTNYLHTRFTNSTFNTHQFGIAIYSKYKIIRSGEVTFSNVSKTYNYCIYVDIVKKSDTFRVYNVHLQSIQFQKDDYALFSNEEVEAGEDKSHATKLVRKLLEAYKIRANQAKKVMAHVKKSPHSVILCGDFNDTPMSYAYNQFSQQLVDSYRNTSFGMGSTYAGKVPAGRIDYIFHDQSMGSRNFVIQKEKLSDHYSITCTVFKQ